MDNAFDKFKEMVPCVESEGCNWLLVMPKITFLDDQQYNFPVGIPYVSSALKATGRCVFTLNLNYKKKSTYDLLHEAITQNNIDILATGGITVQYSLVKEIVDAARKIKPDITIVVGGGLVSSDPIPAMTALESATYGIVGEGEITACELSNALENGQDIGGVRGLVFKNKSGQWELTLQRAEIDSLDIIPWPDYEGFEYEEMLTKTPLDILTARTTGERMGIVFYSRSCPFNCTFCFHSSGKKYRMRSIDSFFEEFEYLVERFSLSSFFLADEYFIKNIEFVKEFCERIKPYKMRWACSGRVDNISMELLSVLREAGCYRIGFGVESANDHILNSMRKGITRAQIENAFSLCHEVGIEAQGNLIFGDLEETEDTAIDTIQWWKAHQNWALTMHWIIAYPGSHVYKVACERGIIPDPVQFIKDGCPEVNFSKMTVDERRHIAATIDMLSSEAHDTLQNASILPGQTGKVTVSGNCPFCEEYGTYYNLDPIRPIKLEICSECNQTLRLFAQDYMDERVVDANVRRYLETGKIALWPVVTGLSTLIERVPSFSNENVFVIDSSKYKQNVELSGKMISSPYIISEKEISIVFVTTSTSVGMEIISQIRTGYPEVKKVGLVGDLFFS